MTFYDPISAYNYHTDKYKLPFGRVYTIGLTSGVGPLSEAEYHKFGVIDFQLRGAARAFGDGNLYVSGIVSEGDYGQAVTDDQAIVQLDAFTGILNDVAIGRQDISVGWSGVDITRDQFLFVKLIEEAPELGDRLSSRAGNDLDTFVQDGPAEPNNSSMLVAIRRSGLMLNIDSDLPQRVNLNLLTHIESPNPHGGSLIQDQIVVSGINVQTNLSVDGNITVLSGINVPENGSIDVLGGIAWKDGKIENDLYVYGGSILQDALFAQVSGTVLQAQTVEFAFEDYKSPYNSGSTVGFQASPRISGVVDAIHNFGKLAMSGNIVLVGGQFEIDQVRPSSHGAILDQHLADIENPHNITPVRISGISRLGVGDSNQWSASPFRPSRTSPYWRLQGHWPFLPGVGIDGVDPSALHVLLEGHSGLDAMHTHPMLPRDGIFLGHAPEYPGLCISGLSPGTFETSRFSGQNWYDWYSYKEDDVLVYSRVKVPAGVDKMHFFEVDTYVSQFGNNLAKLRVSIYDTDGIKLSSISQAWLDPNDAPQTIRFSGGGIGSNLGGRFVENEEFDIEFRMRSASGIGIHLGRFRTWWT